MRWSLLVEATRVIHTEIVTFLPLGIQIQHDAPEFAGWNDYYTSRVHYLAFLDIFSASDSARFWCRSNFSVCCSLSTTFLMSQWNYGCIEWNFKQVLLSHKGASSAAIHRRKRGRLTGKKTRRKFHDIKGVLPSNHQLVIRWMPD